MHKLESMKTLKMAALKDDLFKLKTRGGTDMEAGINAGTSLFHSLSGGEVTSKQNRIMFLTDAQVCIFLFDLPCTYTAGAAQLRSHLSTITIRYLQSQR